MQALVLYSMGTFIAAVSMSCLTFFALAACCFATSLKDQLHCLQGVYRAFIRNAKFMTQSSAPDVAFVGSCVVEMFGLDLVRAYEHAFTYIKQLATLLRGAMSSQSTDAYREIYCWQTVSTLELWCKLLAAHHDKEVLPLRVLCSHSNSAQAQLLKSQQCCQGPCHFRCTEGFAWSQHGFRCSLG